MKLKNIVIVSGMVLIIALLVNQFIKNNSINFSTSENEVAVSTEVGTEEIMEGITVAEIEDLTEMVGTEVGTEVISEVDTDVNTEISTESNTETSTKASTEAPETEVKPSTEANISGPVDTAIKKVPTRYKTRVIAMTDGEMDDQASMVRFLLYSNEMEIEAIIQTNSFYQIAGHSQTSKDYWLENQIEAYGKVQNNLRGHDKNYPTKEFLLSRLYVGDENPLHILKDDVDAVPPFENTPGSNRIIEVLLDSKSSPVWIQAWGGLNTVAQAFYELKYSGNYSINDYKKATQKAKIYSISYQDNSGKYIQEHFPEIMMIKSFAFAKTWGYDNPQGDDLGTGWVDKYIKNHGALADLYPKRSILEGDTPSFLNFFDNGLRAYVHPTYGGWGGRFKYSNGLYVDSYDQGSESYSIERFVQEAQNDFSMRLDWCITANFNEANHRPYAIVDQEYEINVNPGDTIKLSGSGSFDPDGDDLTFLWWQYEEADTATTSIRFDSKETSKDLVVIIPKDIQTNRTIHLILEVKDNRSPSLTSYRRTVLRVN